VKIAETGVDPSIAGEISLNAGVLKGRDGVGVFDLRSGGSLPSAAEVGQVLYSADGSTFTVQTPLTECGGWLINDQGLHLAVG